MDNFSTFLNYFNTIEDKKLFFVSGCRARKEYIENTFNLYFNEFNKDALSLFENDKNEFKYLKTWFIDIMDIIINEHQRNNETIQFNDAIVLKECFNLLHLIIKYYTSYRIIVDKKEILKNTFFTISQDTDKIKSRIKSFNDKSKKKRKTREERAFFVLSSRMLNLLISEKYKFRANFYLNFISINFFVLNWEKVFQNEDEEIKTFFFEILDFFMYPKISEKRIKNSLMILVFAYLKNRLSVKDKDSLDLTNNLREGLFTLEEKNDYTKDELSKNIYLYKSFNYLPIFAHNNLNKYESYYSEDEEKKIIQTMKKGFHLLKTNNLVIPNKIYDMAYKNLHINYIKQELIFLYQ